MKERAKRVIAKCDTPRSHAPDLINRYTELELDARHGHVVATQL